MTNIQSATLRDAPRLLELFNHVCKESFVFPEEAMAHYRTLFQEDSLGSLLSSAESFLLKAEIDKSVAGIIVGLKPEAGLGTIMWLLVAPEHHRKGIGALLFDAACSHYKTIGVHKIKLTAPTKSAVEFYKHIGFKEEGFHPNHWWGMNFWSLGINI